MKRTLLLIFSVLLLSYVKTASGAEISRETPLLRDGYVINGVDGSLIGPDSNDAWFFKLTSDVNDYRNVIKAGTMLELLPSATLEKMTADRKARTTTAYRLWNSRVTRYKGGNFIFPGYFMPLSKSEKPESSLESQHERKKTDSVKPEQQRKRQLELDEPNDVLEMPQEIREKLKTGREKPSAPSEVRPEEFEEMTEQTPSFIQTENDKSNARSYSRVADSVLVDRTGFLIGRDDGGLVFVPDALGRNVQNRSLHLLPCAALESAEKKQADEPEEIRFKVSGIVTKYKGKTYLLLEKAIQTYSHGNFGR